MEFTHLWLKNWRNFTTVDVPLTRRMFLVGPNAAGKSNLLNAFRFLHDIVRVGGGVEKAIEERGGFSRLRCLAARRETDVSIKATMSDPGGVVWKYELTMAQDNQRKPYVKREHVTKNSEVVADRTAKDSDDRDVLRQTLLEQATANRSFAELAEFFRTISYYHIVPQLIREPDRSAGRISTKDPFGGDFLFEIAKVPLKTQTSRLKRITKALQIAVPQLSELELERDVQGRPHLRGKYQHWREQGAWQSEADFSDGTLRLLGLLWSLLDGSGPILLEEPELSLHSEVIRHIPQMMARLQRRASRQIILSTHSTDLLRDEGIRPEEVLVLLPSENGTEVRVAESDQGVVSLMKNGVSAADAILPLTRPATVEQLSLFGQ